MMNNRYFRWKLSQGDEFTTPEAMLAFTDKGLSELSFPEVMYVRLRGLDPDAMYEVDNCISSGENVLKSGVFANKTQGAVYSGAALMNAGYAFDPMFGTYPAIQLHFRRI